MATYTPTPARTTLAAPTEGEVATYQTGTDRFVNLAQLGGFQKFPISSDRFNCFAWSVGFTDRWIQGGTKAEMVRLYEAYMFKQCLPADAEVELYAINDAPDQLTRTIPARGTRPARIIPYTNTRAYVMHAHRRDDKTLDAAPGLGCSSKLAAGPLVAHNRLGLADGRTWNSANPQIVYGAIYQWWQRDPAAHPTIDGNEANVYPVAGHYPDDRVFEAGYGTYPPGHPGNTIGLPGGTNNTTAGGSTNNTKTAALRPSSAASTRTSSSSTSSTHSRNSSSTSATSASSAFGKAKVAPAPAKPWVFLAASRKAYPNIRLTSPYEKIPAVSAKAATAAKATVTALGKDPKIAPIIAKFDAAWTAFIAAWQEIARAKFGDDASACARTAEFRALMALAPNPATVRALTALVVARLATEPANFVGLYVYNALETKQDYLVYKKDMFSYNVLQRHANLIVEMNAERQYPN